MVVNDEEKDDVVKLIMRNARPEKGNIVTTYFHKPVEDAYTISTSKQD
jgi:nitrogen regulatory protein PII 1